MKRRYLIIFALFAFTYCYAQDIMVNQAGYLTERKKIVYFTQAADSFYVADSSSGAHLFGGKIEVSRLNDAATGTNVYYGDFSSFDTPGTYEIKTNTGETSYPFEISSNPYTAVYDKSLKGYYFQRCGTALSSAYAGKYARPACHLKDAVFDPSTGRSGSRDETGGWHDAGDYGKYVVNAGITVGTMLMGYEQFTDNFKSDDLNIPESGNSVPDILDEVRYELDWLLKMQDTDGGVYFKVTPHNFSGFIMPNTDISIRYIFQKSSAATGDFAAVTAMAARIYRPFDSSFSSECLNAAENAWLYLKNNPTIVPPGGFHNPSGTNTGEYGDGNDSDERLWAAVELFNTTGESEYQTYYLNNYKNVGLIYYAMSWGDVGALAQMEYMLSQQPGVSQTAVNDVKNSLVNYCSQLYNNSKNDGFNITLNTSDYYWGSNGVVLNNAVLLIIGYKLTGNMNFYNTALEQFNYILGTNINDICYVTGIGTKSPMHIHHRPSASDGITDPVPGLLAGGPNKDITNDPVLQSMYTSSTPPARCYADNQGSYASNEIAINWNAPLVFTAGYFSGAKNETGTKSETGSVPTKMLIEQNYPNPFNPSTVISYSLPKASRVRLTVYDLLGRQIAVLINDREESSGTHRVTWNGRNDDGLTLPSGIFFYSLTADNSTLTKKMVMLK